MSLPNALSILRLLLVPVLFALALADRPGTFLVVLCVSLLSDLIDGPIARHLNQASERGARLDSHADLAMYITLPICAVWLWPDVMRAQWPYLAAIVACYMAPAIYGIIKFEQLPSLHTYLAKLSAVVVSLACLLMYGFNILEPFRWCVPLAALTALDEFAIILLLRRPQSNVGSTWHALRMRRDEEQAGHNGKG